MPRRLHAPPMRSARIGVLVLLVLAPAALAHGTSTFDERRARVGWENEPATTGLANAIVVELANATTGAPLQGLVLTVEVRYHNATLAEVALEESAPGKYRASFRPNAPGYYDVVVSGAGPPLAAALDERVRDPLPPMAATTPAPALVALAALALAAALRRP